MREKAGNAGVSYLCGGDGENGRILGSVILLIMVVMVLVLLMLLVVLLVVLLLLSVSCYCCKLHVPSMAPPLIPQVPSAIPSTGTLC